MEPWQMFYDYPTLVIDALEELAEAVERPDQ